MANINSLTSNSYSSTSSIYGNKNVLTGLASGMDTETMIENSVTGYQTKIQQLQQSQEKLTWKQDAYRELIDQMYSITNKYTSYTSTTNLSSNSFFTNNVTTTANGANASAVTATGKATSNIQINAVTQLATAARYAVDAGSLDFAATGKAEGTAIDWGKTVTKGTLSGTMTLKIGNSSVNLKFTDEDVYDSLDKLVEGINGKLQTQNASAKATLDGEGTITFSPTGSSGNAVYISGASGNLRSMLNVTTATSSADENRFQYKSFSLRGDASGLSKTLNMAEYLSGKTMDVTLDGTTKTIKIGDLSDKTVTFTGTDEQGVAAEKTKKLSEMSIGEMKQAAVQISEVLRADVQASVDKEFGKSRITVGLTDTTTLFDENGVVSADSRGLKFDVPEGSGSALKVTSSAVGEELGIGDAGVSNYFNTGKKLSALLGDDWLNANARTAGTVDFNVAERYFDVDGNELKKEGSSYYKLNSNGSFLLKDGAKVEGFAANALFTDAEGKLVKQDETDGNYYRVNEKGEWLYNMKINGETIDGFTKNSTLESVLNKISSNTAAGVRASYSNLTSQFVFTANETGAGGSIEFGEGLAQKLFGVKNTPENKSVGSLFGDSIQWDEDGNADILVSAPRTGLVSMGTFNKNDSLEKFMDAFSKVKNGYFDGWFTFDETNGTYSLQTTNGASYEDRYKNKIQFRGSDQTSVVTLDELAERAGSTEASLGYEKTNGQDAIIKATVNGKDLELKRSGNVVNMDGLTVTLREEFSAYGENGKVNKNDAVTFTTSSDADKIVDTIKSFVEDVNKLMTSVHDAFTKQPITKTSAGSKSGTTYYEPLTEEDKNDMSESAIEKYEEKAKTGLLFGDTDLRTLYDKLLTSVQSFGMDRVDMESIGLTTSYSSGVTTFSLNEDKLRAALDSDPDKVRTVFTKTRDGGSATEGLMSSLKSTLNAYASTSIGSPGILVNKAGTRLSAVSLLNNNLYKQISNIDSQIENWQTKLSDKIDYYTKQFTALEKMMSTLNNQSSMLADLMGY